MSKEEDVNGIENQWAWKIIQKHGNDRKHRLSLGVFKLKLIYTTDGYYDQCAREKIFPCRGVGPLS